MSESKKKQKWRLPAALGLLFLVFHFVMVLVYVHHEAPSNTFLHLNEQYIVPAFHQKWPLFAPDPADYDCHLQGRYYANGKWGSWENTNAIREKHFKIKHLEATLTTDFTKAVYSNSGLYYVDDEPQFDRLEKNFFFHEVYYYMYQYFKQFKGVEPDSIQVRLDYSFPEDFHTGKTPEPIRLELSKIKVK